MNERERRLAENEALYREVNERVEQLQQAFGLEEEPATFVCECSQLECTQRIVLSIPEYEHVRADKALFALVPGHETPDVESVVEDHDNYVVVRKHETLD